MEVITERGGQVEGTFEIANELSIQKHHFIESADRLEKAGHITIARTRGGRGKRTVYKINPNSPGLPRKVKRHNKGEAQNEIHTTQ